MDRIKINLDELEYLFIFDYYDFPLSFISKKIEKYYYFFYYIENSTYFIKQLSIKDIALIFADIPTRNILEEFRTEENFYIVEYIPSTGGAFLKTIEEYESEKNIQIIDYFPDEESKFESDMLSGLSFSALREKYTEYFSELFNNKDLTIKLIDENNSHSSAPDVIISTITFIKKFIEEHKEYLRDNLNYSNDVLKITPFSPGSFNINFQLTKSNDVTLFNEHDEQNFDDFILFFDSLVNTPPEIVYENFVFENKEIIRATGDFYESLKKAKVDVELLNGEQTKVSEFKINEKTDEYFKDLVSLVSENKVLDTTEEVFKFKGTVASASKLQNHVIIDLIEGKIKAKFTKDLFSEIKKQERIVSVSKEISGKYKKITSFDYDHNEIASKFEVIEFIQ